MGGYDLGELRELEKLELEVIAGKRMLIVSGIAGVGKTYTSRKVLAGVDNVMRLNKVTPSTVRYLNWLNNFDGVIEVELEGWTAYSRITTLKVLAALVYTGGFVYITRHQTTEVKNFKGSVIVNVQPPVLQTLKQEQEWDYIKGMVQIYELRGGTK